MFLFLTSSHIVSSAVSSGVCSLSMASTFSSSAVPIASSSDPTMAQASTTFEMADRKGAHGTSEEVNGEKHGAVEVIGDVEGERTEATKSTNDDRFQMERLGKFRP